MGRKRSTELTLRQREWLGHLRAAAQSGETIRGSAKRHRLSEHAIYQAAKNLRQRGVWPVASGRRPEKRRPTFAKVAATAPPAGVAGAAWRARLPNGVVLEGSGALGHDLLEALAGL